MPGNTQPVLGHEFMVEVPRLEHRGFDFLKDQDRFALENMGNGWKSFVLSKLARTLVEEV